MWWACLFACCGFFPFHRIESRITRGIAVTIASWALGWLSARLIYWVGPGVDGIFPLVGTTWFLLALLCFAGGNWPVKALGPARQFLMFGSVERMWGFAMVRYRGPVRRTRRGPLRQALANSFVARGRLPA